ncbi:LysR substrate-binding domain-containing protein [Paenirhodobacter populi]|uniref:LysR substrate-binding domain-containing protein n=1 Tax=Paenirhodobacter populi TaxID=2306993 RepID=UPI0013E3A706|nr:LysR substrate-binding domain-containing protein [Sinirhodobacter populi]
MDVIEEGFDAVIRAGEQAASRLMARKVGSYRKVIVGSPAYLQAGRSDRAEDLAGHASLICRYPSTGKLDKWPLRRNNQAVGVALPASMVMNTLDPQIYLAEQGLGFACIPDIAVRKLLDEGSLVSVLDDSMRKAAPHCARCSHPAVIFRPSSGRSWTSRWKRSCRLNEHHDMR